MARKTTNKPATLNNKPASRTRNRNVMSVDATIDLYKPVVAAAFSKASGAIVDAASARQMTAFVLMQYHHALVMNGAEVAEWSAIAVSRSEAHTTFTARAVEAFLGKRSATKEKDESANEFTARKRYDADARIVRDSVWHAASLVKCGIDADAFDKTAGMFRVPVELVTPPNTVIDPFMGKDVKTFLLDNKSVRFWEGSGSDSKPVNFVMSMNHVADVFDAKRDSSKKVEPVVTGRAAAKKKREAARKAQVQATPVVVGGQPVSATGAGAVPVQIAVPTPGTTLSPVQLAQREAYIKVTPAERLATELRNKWRDEFTSKEHKAFSHATTSPEFRNVLADLQFFLDKFKVEFAATMPKPEQPVAETKPEAQAAAIKATRKRAAK